MLDIHTFGWTDFFKDAFKKYENTEFEIGRVAAENKNNYLVFTKFGEVLGENAGKLLYNTDSDSDLPKAGDWVIISLFDENTKAIIHDVLPRKTKLSRKVAGKKTEEQIIASNIDVVFVVQSLDATFNINRIERFLVSAYESKAKPVVILSKSDLCENLSEKVAQLKNTIPNVDILTVSTIANTGIEQIRKYVSRGVSVAFIGASGVGKSSIINKMLGKDIQQINDVRQGDAKGKHTTTRRELIILPEGGILIDTPGMRELQLWNAEEGLAETFDKIHLLGQECHFVDCTHIHETKCAVKEALAKGEITQKYYENYLKMNKELKYLESRQDSTARQIEQKKWKTIHKEMKYFNKRNK